MIHSNYASMVELFTFQYADNLPFLPTVRPFMTPHGAYNMACYITSLPCIYGNGGDEKLYHLVACNLAFKMKY